MLINNTRRLAVALQHYLIDSSIVLGILPLYCEDTDDRGSLLDMSYEGHSSCKHSHA